MIGTTLSHYKILEKIGQGGMGEVFLAQDTTLDRKVALKFLTEELQQDPTAKKRFLREAKSAAALDHPYICHIHEVGEAEGKSFIAMEYVQGMMLQDKLAKGPLPVRDAVETAAEIAEALEAAHKQNIVHRDLKPSNIMLTPEGHVKVMDFGLAKRITPVEGQDEEEITTKLTKDDSILGTVPYMSPEQLRGREVDARSDIFSFGVVLYEMLAGVHPFKKSGQIETANAILSETAPPLSRYAENIPILLQHAVKKMLAKESDRRFQSVHEVRTDLGELLEGSGDLIREVATGPSGVSGRRRAIRQTYVWLALTGALVLLAALAGSVLTVRTPQESVPPVTRLSIGPVPLRVAAVNHSRYLTISPDGSRLAYQSSGQIWLKPMDQADPVPVATGTSAFFSPDGAWLGFFGSDGLRKIPVAGGSSTLLAALSFGTGTAGRLAGGTWGPDGTIVFATGLGLFRISADSGSDEVHLLIEPPDGEVYAWPQFLPNGRSVLFSMIRGSSAEMAEIAILDLDSGTPRVIHHGGVGPYYVPEGYLLYATERGLEAIAFDPDSGQVLGAPAEIPGVDLLVSGTHLAAAFAISNTGTLVHIPMSGMPSRSLIWTDHEGNEEIINGSPAGIIRYPRVSPEGDRLALDVSQAGGTERRIWMLDLERGGATQVSGGDLSGVSFEDLLPQWSPDGERIYFASTRTGHFQVYSVAADGSGTEQLLVDNEDVQVPYRIDRQNRLLFFKGPFPTADVGLMDLANPEAGPEWVLVRPPGENNAVLSPDGNWIAYESNESGDRYEIYVRPFPKVEDRRELVSVGGGRHPLWDPRENDVLYYRNLDGDMMAASLEVSPSFRIAVEKLFPDNTNNQIRDSGWTYDINPRDGRFILIKESEESAGGETLIWVTLNWFEELKRLVPTN